jgi:hypothetical protein
MNTRGTSFEGNLERAHHYRKAAAHYDQAIHHYGQAGDVDRQEILQPLRDFSHEAARDHFLNASAQTDDREQTDQLDAFAKEHHAALGGKTSWHESDESVDEGAKEDLHKVYDTYARSFHGPKKNIKVRLAPIKPEVDPELKATDLSVRAQTVRNRGYSTRPNSVPQQHFDRLINLGGFGGPADVVKRLRAAKRELERRELAEPKRDPEGEEAAEDTAQDQVAKTAAGLKLLVKLAPVEKERSLSKTAAQEFRRQVNKQAKAEREKGVSTSLNPRLLPHFINRFPPRGDKGDPSGLEVAMNSTKRGHPNDPEGGDRRRDPEWMADYMRSWIRNREARQRRAG